ncbi:LacI family DNA-binding transcriptional regulator [Grimontia kaedaensis]|uniref:Autoinducer 2-binding periplasmic protein LuxP n=1 Tax=Grimontia kaedaensis TaxID=2872157 RepID=A0ABY4WX56_9GAMM|nr:LacI family DNA-binding transcriptional regulator [Grimontia kaedaensis]USH03570.1 LacI family DNA-binding transcriptional regulator [Grimontia kaedaensis]
MKPKQKFRLSDIADLAGVSTATVDRVLNRRPNVRALTAERVWEAYQKLKDTKLGQTLEERRLKFKGVIHCILPSGAGPSIDENLKLALQAVGGHYERPVSFHFYRRIDPVAFSHAIEQALNEGAGALVVLGIDHPRTTHRLSAIRATGMPVVSLLSNLSVSPQLSHVGMDNRAAGKTAGALMGRFLRADEGEVAILCGSSMYQSHEDREMGFRAALRERCPSIRVLDVLAGKDGPEDNHDNVVDLIRCQPNLKGIYNVGSGNRGIVSALIELGIEKDIVVVAHNLTSSSRDYLISHAVDAIIHQNMNDVARGAFELLAGSAPATGSKIIRTEIILQENLPIE